MLVAPMTAREDERLRILEELRILDSPSEETFDAMTRLAADLLGVPIALVSLVDANRQWFKSRHGITATETPREVAFCAHAIRQTGPFVIGDAASDERFHDNPLVTSEPHVRAYAGVPLLSIEGHALGTLCAIDHQPRVFTERELAILKDLATICQSEMRSREAALKAQALAEERQRYIEEREALYRATVDGAAVGMALVSTAGEWQMVNRQLCEILGRGAQELIGSNFREVTHPADLEGDLQWRRLLLSGSIKRATREKRYLKADGQVIWAQVEGTVRFGQGEEVEGVIVVIQDITARKTAEFQLQELHQQLEDKVERRTRELQQTNVYLAQEVQQRQRSEAALAASEGELRAVLANALDAYIAIGDDGVIREWNAQAETTFGWSRAEAVGQPLDQLIIPHVHSRAHAVGMQRANLGLASRVLNKRIELPALRKDGTQILCEVAITRLPDGPRGTLYAAFLQDITERKAVQKQLFDSESRLEDLYENAPCGYLSLGPDGRFLSINALGRSWFGAGADELIGTARPWDLLSGASKRASRHAFETLMRDGRVPPMEFDLPREEGNTRRVSIRSTALRDEQGHFLMCRSVMFDITELHEAKLLLESAHRQQALMLNNDLIGIVKLRNRAMTWHNRAFARMLGAPDADLVGIHMRDVYADQETFDRVGREGYPVLAQGGTYRTQVQLRHDGASPLWADMSGTLLSGDSDESMWLLLDIREMKARQVAAERRANTDPLTGLANRTALMDALIRIQTEAAELSRVFGVCFIDLNGFKAVNDTLGHDAGDELLKAVSSRLLSCVRADDLVARLGGDEFVVVLNGLDSPEHAQPVISRIADAIAEPAAVTGERCARVTASIGTAFYPHQGIDVSDLLAQADAGMYAAKRVFHGALASQSGELSAA